MRLSEIEVKEGPKDFDDMKMDASTKQESLDYFYKKHAANFGKPRKAGSFKGFDIVTFTKGQTTLMFLVDNNDTAVFYVALDKHKNGVAVGNVRSNGTVKATDVYAYLISKYKRLYSDAHQTPQGRKIWANLAKYHPKLNISDTGDRLLATEAVSKDDFHKKLKYDMKLVNGITKHLQLSIDSLNDNEWINADMELEFWDDGCTWTVEIRFKNKPHITADNFMEIFKAQVSNYKAFEPDLPLSAQLLNHGEGYALIGIQLDI